MAVEANHLLDTRGQKGWEGGVGCYGVAEKQACYYGAGRDDVVAFGSQSQLPLGYRHQQSSTCVAAPPASGPIMMTTTTAGQFAGQVCASESGVTFGGAREVMVASCGKRKRNDADQFLGRLDAAGVAAHLQQQLVDVDRLVLQHTAKMCAEIKEQRRRYARQVVAAAAKRLQSKDEEIDRLGRLNWALEERVKSLFVEAQVWRDLAQSNEATVNALRGELQQALDAQQARRGSGATTEAAGGADDAESRCCGENNDYDVAAGEEEEVIGTTRAGRRCTVCGQGAAEVLLLPCRHLCACASCAEAAVACPACGCAKNGSVNVNFS